MSRHPGEIRVARIQALIAAQDAGLLEGITLQELADALEVGHRSTILRDLRLAGQAKKLIGPMLERIRNLK